MNSEGVVVVLSVHFRCKNSQKPLRFMLLLLLLRSIYMYIDWLVCVGNAVLHINNGNIFYVCRMNSINCTCETPYCTKRHTHTHMRPMSREPFPGHMCSTTYCCGSCYEWSGHCWSLMNIHFESKNVLSLSHGWKMEEYTFSCTNGAHNARCCGHHQRTVDYFRISWLAVLRIEE